MSDKHEDAPWRDEETLREEYVHKQRTTYELAEEWGCNASTVNSWVRKYGLDKYSQLPKFTLGSRKDEELPDGKRNLSATREQLFHRDERGSLNRIYHHRLLAVAEWGLDAIRGKDVHHQNGIRWDNRPDNLELLTRAEHRREHCGTEMVDGEPWYAEDNLRRLYHELEWSTYDIAEKYDVGTTTVNNHMEKHGIERRSKSEANRLCHQDGQQQTLDSFSKRSSGDD